MPPTVSEGGRRRVRDALRVTLPVMAALGGLIALKLLRPEFVDQQKLLAVFQPMGAWAPLAFLGFLAVRPVALVPGQLLCAVGGMIFGGFWGSVYALVGSVLSTALIFGVMSRIGTRPMRRIVGRRYDAIREVARHHDFKFATLCTLNPLLPTDLIVSAMAASGTRFYATIGGVLLGTVPGTIATAYFGSSLGQGDPVMTAVAVSGIAVSLVLGVVFGRGIARDLRAAQQRLGAQAAAKVEAEQSARLAAHSPVVPEIG